MYLQGYAKGYRVSAIYPCHSLPIELANLLGVGTTVIPIALLLDVKGPRVQ